MNSIKDIWNLNKKELNKQFTKNYLRLSLAEKSKNNLNEIDKYIFEKFEENESSLTSDDLYENIKEIEIKFSLEQVWNMDYDLLIYFLDEELEEPGNNQKLKTKVSMLFYNDDLLNKNSQKIVSKKDYFKIMKKSSSLENGFKNLKTKKCELNDYDSDENSIDPVTREKNMENKQYIVTNGYLNLSDEGLTEIPDDLPNNIIKLDLSGNEIEKIEGNVFNGLSSLEVLYLSNNKIKKIEGNVFDELSSLQDLDLGENGIKKIRENAFNGLSSLQDLNLSNNKIEKIEENAFNGLSLLKYLYLSENEIEKIEENAFIGLSSLKYLYLSNNKIKKIEGNTFNGLSLLKVLYLIRNKIEKIEENAFNGSSSLQDLDLYENKIKKIEENTFNGLSSLKILNLELNKIKEIEENTFDGLSLLEELYLGQNKIENYVINSKPQQLKIFY